MKITLNVSGYTENYFPYITETEYVRNIQLARTFKDFATGCYHKRLNESTLTILDVSGKDDYFPVDLPKGELYLAGSPSYKNNILHTGNRIVIQRSWTLEVSHFIEYEPTEDGLIHITKVGFPGDRDPVFFVASAVQLLKCHYTLKGHKVILPLPSVEYHSPDDIFNMALKWYGSSAEFVEVDEDLLSKETKDFFKEIDETGKSPAYPNFGFVGYELKNDEIFYFTESGALTKASTFMDKENNQFNFKL